MFKGVWYIYQDSWWQDQTQQYSSAAVEVVLWSIFVDSRTVAFHTDSHILQGSVLRHLLGLMRTKLSYIQSICTNWSEDTGVFWEYRTDQNKPTKLSKFVLVISSFWILTLKINLVFPISLLIPSVYHKLYHSVPHQSVSLSVSQCTTSQCITQWITVYHVTV